MSHNKWELAKKCEGAFHVEVGRKQSWAESYGAVDLFAAESGDPPKGGKLDSKMPGAKTTGVQHTHGRCNGPE
eukprot:scaffold84882_cov32-Prasinocladus_malaysianus.AAC.1